MMGCKDVVLPVNALELGNQILLILLTLIAPVILQTTIMIMLLTLVFQKHAGMEQDKMI